MATDSNRPSTGLSNLPLPTREDPAPRSIGLADARTPSTEPASQSHESLGLAGVDRHAAKATPQPHERLGLAGADRRSAEETPQPRVGLAMLDKEASRKPDGLS